MTRRRILARGERRPDPNAGAAGPASGAVVCTFGRDCGCEMFSVGDGRGEEVVSLDGPSVESENLRIGQLPARIFHHASIPVHPHQNSVR